MSAKLVRVKCLGGDGTTMIDLHRCQEFSIGPRIIPGEPPVDWSQYHIYYLTPDLRWITEMHVSGRVYFQETPRNVVRNHAFRVGHYPLPPELQTEHLHDKKTTNISYPPPPIKPSHPGAPTIWFSPDPEEVRQFRGVSNGTVKSADEEKTASPAAPPREDEQPAASPASGSVTPEILIRPEAVVDYTALVEDLRRQDKGIPAKLVEFMADKTSASCEDVGREVHDDENARDQTVRMNARRTNDELAKLGSRVSFRVTTGWVFKDVSPE
jgi:hypothetical protein